MPKQEINKLRRSSDTAKENNDIFFILNKNRTSIKEAAKRFMFKPKFILGENLIKLLKELFPMSGISNTQWKMVVSIADKEKNGLVDLDLFFELINHRSKISASVPKIVR